MALKGSLTYKGITVADTHAVVTKATHYCNWVVDQSDGSVSKKLTAHAIIMFYKDAAAYAADPTNYYDQKQIQFTPSVANGANLNIIKQSYVAMKAMDAYKDMTDV